MLFIEQLQYFSENLQKARSATQWQVFLLEQLGSLFSRIDGSNEASIMVIEQAIVGLVEHCNHAAYEDDISLLIVVDYLSQHFSQGDASKQFMVGQVTFCSMLPMRSIPFKVIAVLGLNDGEFPRQRQPLGFDLMSLAKAKLGDRSRRGDDRYLFLEAIISARNALYLSYQGRNIKNNGEKQPSLVVKELMEYLAQGYGWQFTIEEDDNLNSKEAGGLYQLAMQAFSRDNYRGKWPSFDANWLALGNKSAIESLPKEKSNPFNTVNDENEINLTCNQLIRFYQHPSKMFAQQKLNLFFEHDSIMLEDVEPFSVNQLQSYLLRQDLLNATLSEEDKDQAISSVQLRAQLSGKFPDLPTTASLFEGYQKDVQQFGDEIIKLSCDNPDVISRNLIVNVEGIFVSLTSTFTVKNNLLVHYRSSSAKAKDKFSIYLQQLVLQVWQLEQLARTVSVKNDENEKLQQVNGSIGLYFNTKTQKVEIFDLTEIADAKEKLLNILTIYVKGQAQPLLLNGDLAEKVFSKKRGQVTDMTQDRFESMWLGDMSVRGLADDDYLAYFWPECPLYENHEKDIAFIYQDLYQVLLKRAATRAKKVPAKVAKENK
jgi:exodeoxyribonuclease V gamma subunit